MYLGRYNPRLAIVDNEHYSENSLLGSQGHKPPTGMFSWDPDLDSKYYRVDLGRRKYKDWEPSLERVWSTDAPVTMSGLTTTYDFERYCSRFVTIDEIIIVQ